MMRTTMPRRTWFDRLEAAVAAMHDEPCRCGHPESAHTDMGCGAPSSLVWDQTYSADACTCAAFDDQEPEEPR
jgi:hypothetical protein